jgi:hypothetical protein
MQPLTLVYSINSAFLTISVYHFAKSTSIDVMASTIFLLPFSAIMRKHSFLLQPYTAILSDSTVFFNLYLQKSKRRRARFPKRR